MLSVESPLDAGSSSARLPSMLGASSEKTEVAILSDIIFLTNAKGRMRMSLMEKGMPSVNF